jgi:prephenate dehydratase
MTGAAKQIAFQGKPGAYSDLACRAAFPRHRPLPCPSFLDAFEALKQKRADLAMIPVDNSIAGRVADIHYLLPRYDFSFVAEYFLPIDHCLLGVAGAKLGGIRRVLSHTHALPQCRKIIRSHGWEQVVTGDTAGAAARVAAENDPAQAAIAARATADIYGLKVLKRDIADERDNYTRFIALSRAPAHLKPAKDAAYMTSVIFSVRNIAAALYKGLGGFATNGVNMLKLESYMPGGSFAATLFYAEVEGHARDPHLAAALDELRFFATDIRVLGSYPQDPHRLKLRKKAK